MFAFKRPGITLQLFLAVLAVATLVALVMGVAAQLSFSRGFIGYLNAQGEQRLDAAVPRLRAAYLQRERSWAFLQGQPGAWFRLIDPEASHQGERNPEPLTADPAPHLLGVGRRMTLLDAQHQRVIGYGQLFADTALRPIEVDGHTVGWLALAPVQSATDAASLRFSQQQERATLAIAALALALAGAVAWWMARVLLAPLQEVAQATHRLAAGQHDTRVQLTRHDEVGQLAQDFNQLALALGRTERMRREHMADLSHELRTPLAVLRGEIEAMQDGIRPLSSDSLAVLHGEVDALTQLVDDLHELALADVGALTYRKRDLDLAALVRTSALAQRERLAPQGLTLAVDIPAQPLPLQADPERLGQLLRNLFDNAARYTDAPGQIRLQLQRDGAHALLSLQDSAPGVPAEQLPRLFERFYRLEPSRGRASGGSGLGLALCRSIAQAHGGTISAQESPLGGVWITLRLPLLQAQVQAPRPPVPESAARLTP